ncbi:hypothetical protein [Streptomyces sp. NRRL B-24720]|nr:hypothetical protein [Streptomyces sp. NRRL B-24720]
MSCLDDVLGRHNPFFTTSAGRAPTARVELLRLARERGQRTAWAS